MDSDNNQPIDQPNDKIDTQKITPQNDSSDEEDLFKNYKKTWTTEELSKEIDELAYHPLFIKPDAKMKDTPELLGLQNLLYSEDDHTLAENFSNQASSILNEKYLTAKDKDSQNFFLHKALEKINEAIPLEKNDKPLMCKLLSNRAFVNGKLGQIKSQSRKSRR